MKSPRELTFREIIAESHRLFEVERSLMVLAGLTLSPAMRRDMQMTPQVYAERCLRLIAQHYADPAMFDEIINDPGA